MGQPSSPMYGDEIWTNISANKEELNMKFMCFHDTTITSWWIMYRWQLQFPKYIEHIMDTACVRVCCSSYGAWWRLKTPASRLFTQRFIFWPISKKTPKLRVTRLCAGKSLVIGEFPAQMPSNADKVFIWWRHHDFKLHSKSHRYWSLMEHSNEPWSVIVCQLKGNLYDKFYGTHCLGRWGTPFVISVKLPPNISINHSDGHGISVTIYDNVLHDEAIGINCKTGHWECCKSLASWIRQSVGCSVKWHHCG